jgi:hypothetical protein
VPGSRRAKVSLRSSPDGSFALVVDGVHSDSDIREIFRGGRFSLTDELPDAAHLRIALLKNAYLAACLAVGEPLSSPDADTVRAELLAAINDQGLLEVGPGSFASRLIVLRVYDEPPYPLYLATAQRGGAFVYGFGLGRFGFVSWPVPDLLDAARSFYEPRA